MDLWTDFDIFVLIKKKLSSGISMKIFSFTYYIA